MEDKMSAKNKCPSYGGQNVSKKKCVKSYVLAIS